MCLDGMADVDLSVNRIIPKPWDWPEFYSYAHSNFVLRDDSWNAAGGPSPGIGSLPYGKVIHAVYLLTYAIRNEYIPQWHSREDYLAAANGLGSEYHDWHEYQFRNRVRPVAKAFEDDHRTELYCPLFNRGATFDDPASRASMADLAEYSHGWVPVAVTDQARAIGNNLLATRFQNPTSYRIGQPRPF